MGTSGRMILLLCSLGAFVVSVCAFAGVMFGGDPLARILGGLAFCLLGVWFLFLRRRVRQPA